MGRTDSAGTGRDPYLARLAALTAGKDPLIMQAATVAELAELLGSAPEALLKRRPQPDKWSIGEIVAHLADDELVTAWRYRQMLEHPGGPLPGFDQDRWAVWGDYGNRDAQESLALFRLLRSGNLRLLSSLTPAEWEAHGVHAERGRMTVRELARHMAGHDVNHVEQIRAQLAASAAGRMGSMNPRP